jgi:hypothetical protein
LPHAFAAPPPPHVSPPLHVPQSTVPPQPSGSVPQVALWLAHVAGVQTHALELEHVSGAGQLPQLSVPPQPSDTGPHWAWAAAHVVGTQVPDVPSFAPASLPGETPVDASGLVSNPPPSALLAQPVKGKRAALTTVTAMFLARAGFFRCICWLLVRSRRRPRPTALDEAEEPEVK